MSTLQAFSVFLCISFFSIFHLNLLRKDGVWMRLCTEDGAYVREPGWLKDLETAAAIAKLHDVVQASTAYDDTGTIGRRVSMTD